MICVTGFLNTNSNCIVPVVYYKFSHKLSRPLAVLLPFFRVKRVLNQRYYTLISNTVGYRTFVVLPLYFSKLMAIIH